MQTISLPRKAEPVPENHLEVYKVFRGRAFVSKRKISGRDVLGNPASVVILEDAFPDADTLSSIAKNEQMPMTAFIRPMGNLQYEIIYYTPEGKSFGLCGHATLIAAWFLQKQLGKNNVAFVRNFDDEQVVMQTRVVGDDVRILMPAFGPVPVEEDCTEMFHATGMQGSVADYRFFKCTELQDMIIVASDVQHLRAAKPRFKAMAATLSRNNIRGLFITAPSREEEADYEVRIFAPHLGIAEDISCGSANCSLLPFWSSDMNADAGKNYAILCPYNDNENKYGGIELGVYDKQQQQVEIGGCVIEI